MRPCVTRVLGLFALVTLTGGGAWAQPMGFPAQPTTTEGPEGVPFGVTVFVSGDVGLTPYVATYSGDLIFENLAGSVIQSLQEGFTYKERDQRLLRYGGVAGVRIPLPKNLQLTLGFGGSYLELQEENIIAPPAGSAFANQHTEFRTLEPNPGFAVTLGLDWAAFNRSHLSMVVGLNLLYFSSYGLRGTSLEGESAASATDLTLGIVSPGDQLFYADLSTVDMSMHLLHVQPHVGMEWRAVDSYLTNSFGLFGNVVISAGTMTQEVRLQTDNVPATGNPLDVTSTLSRQSTQLSMSLEPLQIFGAYYGWYVSIPHFGTLGVEAQMGSRWNAELSYQYTY